MLTKAQEKMVEVWEEHVRLEFEEKDVSATIKTMTDDTHIINVPIAKLNIGLDKVEEFYSNEFVSVMPDDIESQLISRTVGESQIVDETILKFTHTLEMPWILPGVKATGKRVEVPLVAIIGFKDDKVCSEHIYWDQACVLAQIGFLDSKTLPISGIESAKKLNQTCS
jgi:carboxymethylenebutenolidase